MPDQTPGVPSDPGTSPPVTNRRNLWIALGAIAVAGPCWGIINR
jgi:hypothetical protein